MGYLVGFGGYLFKRLFAKLEKFPAFLLNYFWSLVWNDESSTESRESAPQEFPKKIPKIWRHPNDLLKQRIGKRIVENFKIDSTALNATRIQTGTIKTFQIITRIPKEWHLIN